VKHAEPVIIGLGGSNHDGAAALAKGSSVEVAIEQERISRRKHGYSWWWENPVGYAVDYCLSAVDLELERVDRMVSSDLLPRRVITAYPEQDIRLYPHHLCHAASACAMLPPGTRSVILVYDGMGSLVPGTHPDRVLRETFGFFQVDADGLRSLGQTYGDAVLEHDNFPGGCSNSIGKLYDIVTTIIGFHEDDVGKTMGLAAYGKPRYADLIGSFVTLGDDLSACFCYDANNPELPDELLRVLAGEPGFGVKADLAASVQLVLEKSLLHVYSLVSGLKFDVLCLAGGCGLNSVANARLAAELPEDRQLVVPPYTADSGICFGSLWLEMSDANGTPPNLLFRGGSFAPSAARPGRLYTREQCLAAVNEYYPRLVYDPRVDGPEALAAELAAGNIIGVLNGPSEIGPRALGGRSIFADPRSSEMRERINRTIKLREPFRPLAPMVLAERFSDFFEDRRQADPYMLRVARATKACRALAPAVIHRDGTARVQVVEADADPFLVRLLGAFNELAGLPLLLNTSFNRAGEPIVETPEDAIDAFLGMHLDGLYLDGLYYIQEKAPATR
jgi:carbamoyltransferase